MKSRACAAALAFGCLAFMAVAPRAPAQELWFSPGDDLEVQGMIGHPDFFRLFEEPSTWPTGLAQTKVFQFRAPYLARKPKESANDFAFLKRHHVAIAAAMTVLPAETCGQGIEGTLPRKNIADYPRRIRLDAGIDLDYVVMDEPLYYGHDYSGVNACSYSIPDVAKGVAESIDAIRHYHPHAQFILVEPVQVLANGASELADFLDRYKALVGQYPFAVRLDVLWGRPWRIQLPPFIAMLRARGIPYGVIYNGIGSSSDDESWIASAKQNALEFRSFAPENPGHIVIQTWQRYPLRDVPEGDASTMTGYLKWFVARGSACCQ
jgi:hypothetical protein